MTLDGDADGAGEASNLPDALRALEALADGLVYSSEGDHPFVVVHVRDDDPAVPLSEHRLRLLLALDDATVVRKLPLELVLARHTVLTHPDDERAAAIRPRYEAMQRYLECSLAGAIGLRTGTSPEIAVWMLGRTSDGALVGYRTSAIET